jgi:hypothetical protein
MFSIAKFFSSMLYEPVRQPIDVLAVFRKGIAEPMTFKWGNRYYQVQKVDLVHTEHDGRERIYYFSVSNAASAYRISFRSSSLTWTLEEKCEGAFA